jgi:RNA polymerase sigma-70 factor (ECF subfamily)
MQDHPEIELLLDRASLGDEQAVEQLLDAHRRRLRRMVAMRLDPRLAVRADASDIVQETLLTAAARFPSYLENRESVPFYVWLRGLAWDKLLELNRRHRLAQRRSVSRELPAAQLPQHANESLADRLLAVHRTLSGELILEEVRGRVQSCLAKLKDIDREVLVLRYLEQLPSAQIAVVLDLPVRTVRARHAKALERLRQLLEPHRGSSGDLS